MSQFHQKARLRLKGVREPECSERAKEISDQLWREYYRNQEPDAPVQPEKPKLQKAPEPETKKVQSKTEKRKERAARGAELERAKKKKRESSPVIDRTADPKGPPGPKGPPPAGGGGSGDVDKGKILTGLFEQALRTLQSF